MVSGVHHIGMQGSDPRRSLATYSPFLPLAVTEQGFGAWAAGPNLYLRATHGESPRAVAPVHAIGIAHFCLQSRPAESARHRLEQGGVRLIAAPLPLGTGFHYAYARDPEGRLIELETAPFLSEELPGWFSHVAFVTADLPRLTQFYAALTGLAVEPGSRVRGNTRVDQIAGLVGVDLEGAWITGLNIGLEFWRYHAPALPEGLTRQNGYTHVAFEVDDVGVALAHAKHLGATVLAETAEHDGIARAAISDPDDNPVHLMAFAGAARPLSLQALPHRRHIDHVRPAREQWQQARPVRA